MTEPLCMCTVSFIVYGHCFLYCVCALFHLLCMCTVSRIVYVHCFPHGVIVLCAGNCRVFNEMLNVATPGSAELTSDTTDLLRELSRTCRQMQQRVVLLIEQLADEQVSVLLPSTDWSTS